MKAANHVNVSGRAIRHRWPAVFGALALCAWGYSSPVLARSQPEAPPKARLDVVSEPAQATVLVDRLPRGQTPLSLPDLAPGTHLVTVGKAGYADAWQTVELVAQDRRTVQVKLEPMKGLLLIRSTPTNADVTANGLTLGRTPTLIASLPLGTHRLKIATPGYQAREIEVVLEDRTPVLKQVDLVSDSATLTIACDVPGAKVLVNGIDRGAPPCTVERIPEGEAAIDVRADGYAPFLQKLKLTAGEVQQIKVPLAPMPGSLRIVTVPEKARVYVDNEFRGQSPVDLTGLAPATYRVRVEMEGYDPDARGIEVTRGAAKTEEFRLSSNTGRIELITEPAGVTVFLDGRKVGETHAKPDATTNVSEPLAIEAASAGEHELRAVRKGFNERAQKVQIEQGKTLPVHLALTRRFIPDCQVTTDRAVYKGVLDSVTEDFVRLETAPGIMMPIPVKDIRSRHTLREDGTTE